MEEITAKRFVPGIDLDAHPQPGSYCFVFQKGKLMVAETSSQLCRVPRFSDLPAAWFQNENALYLGSMDDWGCFTVEIEDSADPSESCRPADLRSLYDCMGERELSVAGFASQIIQWDQNYRYCGRCGSRASDSQRERAKICPDCGLVNFPRLSPSIIVAVTRGEEILLACARSFRLNFYSVLAGFVEPGETLEQCVEREIEEEVGIKVRNIRYFGSQSWPFPDSLMVGFTADHDSGEICIDNHEIVDAGWYRADNLPKIPGRISIARRLIDAYIERVNAGSQ
jgi:NAD+ diphosphatase